MTVTLKDHLGERLTDICMPNNTSVGDLKYEIEDRLFIPPTRQRLFYKGVKMQDGPALDDYEISDGSTIHLRTLGAPSQRAGGRMLDSKRDLLPVKVKAFLATHPEELLALFDQMDRNQDQVVSHEEVKSALYETIPGLQPEDMSAVFRAIDDNGSQFVNRREWMEYFTIHPKTFHDNKYVRDIEQHLNK